MNYTLTTGRRYFVDHNTKTTSWSHPLESVESLPTGWRRYEVRPQQYIYINTITNQYTTQHPSSQQYFPQSSQSQHNNNLSALVAIRGRPNTLIHTQRYLTTTTTLSNHVNNMSPLVSSHHPFALTTLSSINSPSLVSLSSNHNNNATQHNRPSMMPMLTTLSSSQQQHTSNNDNIHQHLQAAIISTHNNSNQLMIGNQQPSVVHTTSPTTQQPLVPANPYISLEIPQWLLVYSRAPTQNDHLLDWQLFKLSELDCYQAMLNRLYRSEAEQLVIKFELYRNALQRELELRKAKTANSELL